MFIACQNQLISLSVRINQIIAPHEADNLISGLPHVHRGTVAQLKYRAVEGMIGACYPFSHTDALCRPITEKESSSQTQKINRKLTQGITRNYIGSSHSPQKEIVLKNKSLQTSNRFQTKQHINCIRTAFDSFGILNKGTCHAFVSPTERISLLRTAMLTG